MESALDLDSARFDGAEIGLRVVGHALDRGPRRGSFRGVPGGQMENVLSVDLGRREWPRSPTNTVLSGATIREAALFEMNRGEPTNANSFAGKCPRNGEDSTEILAGIETPSLFSFLRLRPCLTSD